MASKRNKNASDQKTRFIAGTDTEVFRLLTNRRAPQGSGRRASVAAQKAKKGSNTKRFVWACKDDDGSYKHIPVASTELRYN